MSKGKCRVSGCQRPQYARGLCSTCYAAARKKIKQKNTTWASLEKLGLTTKRYTHAKTKLDRVIDGEVCVPVAPAVTADDL